jgi:hypothetical protein
VVLGKAKSSNNRKRREHVQQRRDNPQAIGPAADDSSVPRDTAAQTQNEEQAGEATRPTEFTYTPEERTAIDQANEAFVPVIKAIDTFENIEAWMPPLVRGVRALRDRAMRETGALNYMDQEYRKTFGDLLNAEPIGSMAVRRSSSLPSRCRSLSRQRRHLPRRLYGVATNEDHRRAAQEVAHPADLRRSLQACAEQHLPEQRPPHHRPEGN